MAFAGVDGARIVAVADPDLKTGRRRPRWPRRGAQRHGLRRLPGDARPVNSAPTSPCSPPARSATIATAESPPLASSAPTSTSRSRSPPPRPRRPHGRRGGGQRQAADRRLPVARPSADPAGRHCAAPRGQDRRASTGSAIHGHGRPARRTTRCSWTCHRPLLRLPRPGNGASRIVVQRTRHTNGWMGSDATPADLQPGAEGMGLVAAQWHPRTTGRSSPVDSACRLRVLRRRPRQRAPLSDRYPRAP